MESTIYGLATAIIYLPIFGLSIYALVLFIRLAKRGIKALDIYIEEKSNTK